MKSLKVMNNYIFIRVVGKGSYGEVNLVKNKSDRKQVRREKRASSSAQPTDIKDKRNISALFTDVFRVALHYNLEATES